MRFMFSAIITIFSSGIFAQLSISGSVFNEKREELSYATVFFENTNIATATDEKGKFTISNIMPGNYSLKVIYVGYKPYIGSINITRDILLDIILEGEIYDLDVIEIQSNRVGQSGPFTKTNLDKSYLQKENLGQDVPYILQWTPSIVVTSDAGNGIGYTGMRIRGSDQTRVNVTINGVALNDAESHNVFWVDLPDLIGSVNNIQIQRGVGTSTNGGGAFGGTVSINTSDTRINPYLDISGGLGSFNTNRISIKAGTGLINRKYTFDTRYSQIKSDGFVDRASSSLGSLYFSAARVSEKSSLRLNVLSGKENTYQAWYGVPEAKISGNNDALLEHYYSNLGSIYKSNNDSINLFQSGRSYNYYTYPNQIDNYRQTHLQLLHSYVLNKNVKLKSTLFYTKGKGYYEEFRYDDDLSAYKLREIRDSNGNIVSSADIVRRRWLDNDLLGLNADVEYRKNNLGMIQGGVSYAKYLGDHFGNVIDLSITHPDFNKTNKYYDNTGNKSDFNSYLKIIYDINTKFSIHGDLQWRMVSYSIEGLDNDLRDLGITYKDQFINPKLGMSFQFNKNSNGYFSYARGNKEPIRSDFIDNIFNNVPLPESLNNIEIGYRTTQRDVVFETNGYLMSYNNQLVLSGDVNDVGAPIRINVPKSFRLGWEGALTVPIGSMLALHTNMNISRNKIHSFDEVIADYTDGFEKIIIHHKKTDISFSPSFVGAFQVLLRPSKGFEVELSSKFVSSQYLDNTCNKNRSIPAYSFQNIRILKNITSKFWKNMDITLLVNNLFDYKYVSNGYSYSYIYGNTITENFYYPQSGIQFLMGVNVSL